MNLTSKKKVNLPVIVIAAGVATVAGIIGAYFLYQSLIEHDYVNEVVRIASVLNQTGTKLNNAAEKIDMTNKTSITEARLKLLPPLVNGTDELFQRTLTMNVPDKYKPAHPHLLQGLHYSISTLASSENALRETENALQDTANATLRGVRTSFERIASASADISRYHKLATEEFEAFQSLARIQIQTQDTSNRSQPMGLRSYTLIVNAPEIVTVDFEDVITCNTDLAYPLACIPAFHEWLKSKGIDIMGNPNGLVWFNQIRGNLGHTGIVVGYASPNLSERDEGLSDNETLTIYLLRSWSNFIEIEVTSGPSGAEYNNARSTIVIEAYDIDGNMLATLSETFTGVTDNVYTPARIGVRVAEFGISKITLQTVEHPNGGDWIESMSFATIPTVAILR